MFSGVNLISCGIGPTKCVCTEGGARRLSLPSNGRHYETMHLRLFRPVREGPFRSVRNIYFSDVILIPDIIAVLFYCRIPDGLNIQQKRFVQEMDEGIHGPSSFSVTRRERLRGAIEPPVL